MIIITQHIRLIFIATGAAGLSLMAASCSPPKPEKAILLEETVQPGVWKNSIGMKFRNIPNTDTYMSIYETRIQDFKAFVDETDYDATEGLYYYKSRNWIQDEHSWIDPGYPLTNNMPAAGVNWRDAVAFCLWLTDVELKRGKIKSTQAYRLPTEKEWELAAGTKQVAPIPENSGNFHEALAVDNFSFTSPVGMFSANENGFYDMSGNLWEFCLDEDELSDDLRIIRGGSWQNWHKKFVGVGARGKCGMDIRITLYGFRVVLANKDKLFTSMRNDAIQVSPRMMSEPPESEPLPAIDNTTH